MWHKYLDFFKHLFNIEDNYTKSNLFNPFLIFDNNYLLTRSNNYVSILKLEGIEYTSLKNENILRLHDIRKNAFKHIKEKQVISIVSKNEEENYKIEANSQNFNIFENKILRLHLDNFKKTYSTSYYIIIQTMHDRTIKKSELLNDLKDTESNILNLLTDYNIRKLSNNEVLSYYSSYLNGTKSLMQIKNNIIEDNIFQSNISFKRDYMIFENYQKNYSKWISIMLYENDTYDEELFAEINSLNANISIYQSFIKRDKIMAEMHIDDKIKNLSSFQESNQSAVDEMLEIKQYLLNDEISLFDYKISIQITDEKKEHIDKISLEIKKILEQNGYKTILETINIEATYLSNLPDYYEINPRKRILQTLSIVSLNSFNNTQNGFLSNSFGENPITKFLNTENKIYNFNLHETSLNNALGHSLIVGNSSSGKTTFICFLLGQMKKYDNIKILILDRLYGTEIFTNFYDGEYIDFEKESGMNPLQLQNNKNNRIFLIEFFKIMLNVKDDDEEEKILIEVVNKLYKTLQPNERTFKNLIELFPASERKNDITSRAMRWTNSKSNHFFYSEKDELNFDKTITSINMDKIIQNREAIPLVAKYLFHKLENLANEKNMPFVIFIDELREYLENEYFLEIITNFLIQARKLNAIIIGAIQNIDFFTENKEAKKLLGSNFASFILFPDSLVKEDYQKILNLTDNEYEFIKYNTKPREVLYKKLKGESVKLKIDLKHLKNYINVFNSDIQNRHRMKKLKKEFKKNWREQYIK